MWSELAKPWRWLLITIAWFAGAFVVGCSALAILRQLFP
jgi:hypothetical protein